jgi:nucleoside-diphosphate-sugar epimerase
MRILFIGGTGNISRDCVRESVAKGHEVTILNRKGRRGLVSDVVEIIEADYADDTSLAAAVEGKTWDAVCDFICFTPEQAQRDVRLFGGKTDRFVFISSASVYQKPAEGFLITEETPLFNPWWSYSRDKIACEKVFFDACRESNFPAVVVRPSHTYGEGWFPTTFGHGWTVPARILGGGPIVVHGDGTSLWTLTHTRDFARAFAGLLEAEGVVGEAFHITGDIPLTWNEIHRTIAVALGGEVEVVHVPSEELAALNPGFGAGLLGDKMHCAVFDNAKIKSKVPDWNASIGFRDGIDISVRWMEDNPRYKTVDPKMESLIVKALSSR